MRSTACSIGDALGDLHDRRSRRPARRPLRPGRPPARARCRTPWCRRCGRRPTSPARQAGQTPHPITPDTMTRSPLADGRDRAADLLDRAHELVAEVHARDRHGPVVQVQVAPADRGAIDPQQQPVRSRHAGIGHVLDGDVPFPVQHDSTHGADPRSGQVEREAPVDGLAAGRDQRLVGAGERPAAEEAVVRRQRRRVGRLDDHVAARVDEAPSSCGPTRPTG